MTLRWQVLDPAILILLPELLTSLLNDANDDIAIGGLIGVCALRAANQAFCASSVDLIVRRFERRIDENIVGMVVSILSSLPEPPVAYVDRFLTYIQSESHVVRSDVFDLIQKFAGQWGDAGQLLAKAIADILDDLPYEQFTHAVTLLITALPPSEPPDMRFVRRVVGLIPELHRPTAITWLLAMISDGVRTGAAKEIIAILAEERDALLEYSTDDDPAVAGYAEKLLTLCDLVGELE
jgi:hypothetical protein